MPVNGMSVGRDFSYGYIDGNGIYVDLGDVENVHTTAAKHDIMTRPYNNDPYMGYIEDGYRHTFTISRTGSQLEDLQLTIAERFRQGLSILAGVLNETVREDDGSGGIISKRYQYQRFVFHINDLGTVTREQKITIQAEGFSSKKVRIS